MKSAMGDGDGSIESKSNTKGGEDSLCCVSLFLVVVLSVTPELGRARRIT